jgi:hypothetical protein
MVIYSNISSFRQVDKDCDFLEQERIMDYSMLVGLHFRGLSGSSEAGTPARGSGAQTPTGYASCLISVFLVFIIFT